VKTDYDSPWKDILETYFQSALELCFPQIARQINWSKGVQLLSKEFWTFTPLWIGLWSYHPSSNAKWSKRLKHLKRQSA
jgi:hypothetical protein